MGPWETLASLLLILMPLAQDASRLGGGLLASSSSAIFGGWTVQAVGSVSPILCRAQEVSSCPLKNEIQPLNKDIFP